MKTHVMEGWPPDGSPGEFVGWDAQGRMCVLRWQSALPDDGFEASWIGVRFDPRNPMPGERNADTAKQWPLAFRRGPDTESFVIKHRAAIGARGE